MANLARATIIGRIITDIEQRVLPNSGSKLTTFRMASGRSKKDPNTGAWTEDPDTLYIDVKVFDYPDAKRQLGEVVVKYAKKGDTICCDGSLICESWEDKNGGGKRSKTVLKANEIQLLGGKGDGGGAKEPIDAGDPGETFKPRQQPQRGGTPVDDGEIPF
jgi:single-strand DNA-binding protein